MAKQPRVYKTYALPVVSAAQTELNRAREAARAAFDAVDASVRYEPFAVARAAGRAAGLVYDAALAEANAVFNATK